ncbi:hypothetical protein AB0M43_08090 [Longispora sp. NPDC051575]|uniref:hypothetical protein n=1 Tax=Longispora sp. NPDC051575 TaxID=3154943 RepID=UPI00341E71AE
MKLKIAFGVLLAGILAASVLYTVRAASGPPAASAPLPSPSPTLHGDGLSDSHDGYRMIAVTVPDARGPAKEVAFRILGPDGEPATEYDDLQTQRLHMYVVRDDMSAYQHLHPTLDAGTWRATVAVPDGGAYRVFAEFLPRGRGGAGHPTVLGVPFLIPGDTNFVPLPAPAKTATAGPYTVTRLDGLAMLPVGRSAMMRFEVSDASGTVVTALEPYLGAYAHLSSFESQSLALTHLHPLAPAMTTAGPSGSTLVFHAQFGTRGEQRMFLQFAAGGKVQLAEFTVFVT